MPGVDPPWGLPQETQHCPLCEEAAMKLANRMSEEDRVPIICKGCQNPIGYDDNYCKECGEHLLAMIDELKELKAVANRLMRETLNRNDPSVHFPATLMEMSNFLTSTPTDLVVVKWEDLDWLWKRAHTAILTNNKLTPHCESYNRIEKALEDSK